MEIAKFTKFSAVGLLVAAVCYSPSRPAAAKASWTALDESRSDAAITKNEHAWVANNVRVLAIAPANHLLVLVQPGGRLEQSWPVAVSFAGTLVRGSARGSAERTVTSFDSHVVRFADGGSLPVVEADQSHTPRALLQFRSVSTLTNDLSTTTITAQVEYTDLDHEIGVLPRLNDLQPRMRVEKISANGVTIRVDDGDRLVMPFEVTIPAESQVNGVSKLAGVYRDITMSHT